MNPETGAHASAKVSQACITTWDTTYKRIQTNKRTHAHTTNYHWKKKTAKENCWTVVMLRWWNFGQGLSNDWLPAILNDGKFCSWNSTSPSSGQRNCRSFTVSPDFDIWRVVGHVPRWGLRVFLRNVFPHQTLQTVVKKRVIFAGEGGRRQEEGEKKKKYFFPLSFVFIFRRGETGESFPASDS